MKKKDNDKIKKSVQTSGACGRSRKNETVSPKHIMRLFGHCQYSHDPKWFLTPLALQDTGTGDTVT